MESPASHSANALRVHPAERVDGTVALPGSKSLTNRALIIASLAKGESVLKNVLDCDDSRHLVNALRELGVSVKWRDEDAVIALRGAGGPYPVRSGKFFCGNAGTAVRFLTAALAASSGNYVVDGDARMRMRPIGDLTRALELLGGAVSAPTGCPPVEIGSGPLRGGTVAISGSTSSQFISAILMAAPLAKEPVRVQVAGDLVSRPYVDLTLGCMRAFGARVDEETSFPEERPVFRVDNRRGYKAREYFVEGDASAASYFYAAAAVTGSTIRVEGVGKESLQGDARCADVLAAMGCRVKKERDAVTVTGPLPGLLRGVDQDCSEIPDVVPTLAVVALFAQGRTRLRRVSHLRFKESDRIASVASELRKLGGQVTELRDGLEIRGLRSDVEPDLHGAAIDTWNDHRLAMAFSVAALVIPGVVIERPAVVAKSFPGYFDVLRGLGVRVEEVGGAGRTATS